MRGGSLDVSISAFKVSVTDMPSSQLPGMSINREWLARRTGMILRWEANHRPHQQAMEVDDGKQCRRQHCTDDAFQVIGEHEKSERRRARPLSLAAVAPRSPRGQFEADELVRRFMPFADEQWRSRTGRSRRRGGYQPLPFARSSGRSELQHVAVPEP